jgi:hypothetical protein
VQVTTEVAEHLANAAVTVQPYEKVIEDIEAAAEAGTRIWMDPSQACACPFAHLVLLDQQAPSAGLKPNDVRVCCRREVTTACAYAQVSFALAQAASGASAKRGTKRKADGNAASAEPVSATLLYDML